MKMSVAVVVGGFVTVPFSPLSEVASSSSVTGGDANGDGTINSSVEGRRFGAGPSQNPWTSEAK